MRRSVIGGAASKAKLSCPVRVTWGAGWALVELLCAIALVALEAHKHGTHGYRAPSNG